MSEEFAVTERPLSTTARGKRPSELSLAVAETVDTGKAVTVRLNGTPVNRLRTRLSLYCGRHGLKLRQRSVDDDNVVFWAERKSA